MYHCISQHLASTRSSVLWGRNSTSTCIRLHRSNTGNHSLANNEIELHESGSRAGTNVPAKFPLYVRTLKRSRLTQFHHVYIHIHVSCSREGTINCSFKLLLIAHEPYNIHAQVWYQIKVFATRNFIIAMVT